MVFGAKSKKGNAVLDGLTIVIVVIVFAIGGIYGYSVLDELNTDIQNDADIGSEAKSVSSNLSNNYVDLIDGLFMFMLILFTVFVLISVFLIDTHPIFFVVSLILLIFVFIVAGLLANAYDDIVTDSSISFYANQFTFIGFIMSHLLETIIGIVFLAMIVMYAKFKS